MNWHCEENLGVGQSWNTVVNSADNLNVLTIIMHIWQNSEQKISLRLVVIILPATKAR